MATGSDLAKQVAARSAVERYVRPGLRLALGTGTTAAEALRAIVELHPQGSFDCVASSRATEELARELGLGVRALRADDRFDLMIDGADEVTPSLDLTKGRGGALLREKLLARLSRDLVVVVDDSKLVRALGERAPIPVEVVPFARPVVVRSLEESRYRVAHRALADGRPFRTDNGNEILDLTPPSPLTDPAAADRSIRSLTGVVETGLFCGLAQRAVVGHADGRVEERVRPRSDPP